MGIRALATAFIFTFGTSLVAHATSSVDISRAPTSSYLQLTGKVNALGGRQCSAYIHALKDSKGLPLIIALAGTGLYSTGDLVEGNPLFQSLVDQRKVVVVSIDKPGISFDRSAQNHFVLDDSIYNSYTQRDLIECVRNAVEWASKTKFSSLSSSIYIIGMSEGSQVADRSYRNFTESDPKSAKRIRALFLAGVVTESWKSIINRQIPDATQNTKFWDAYTRRNSLGLRKFGDLAYAYWSDILSTESNLDTLKTIAATGPSAHLEIFEGLDDENTLASGVMDFESWNADLVQKNHAGWILHARYYKSGHGLNTAAVTDIVSTFDSYLNQPSLH